MPENSYTHPFPRLRNDATGTRDRVTLEASMAKLHATEATQRVIDAPVLLFGGLGVTVSNVAKWPYHEIRPLRKYEGAGDTVAAC